MNPDARAKGIMRNSPRDLPALLAEGQNATMAIHEEDMDTEAYEAMLENMTIDDTTHHFGPLTEDDDARTENDLTIMGDISESIALKSSRSNKNVSWRDNLQVRPPG